MKLKEYNRWMNILIFISIVGLVMMSYSKVGSQSKVLKDAIDMTGKNMVQAGLIFLSLIIAKKRNGDYYDTFTMDYHRQVKIYLKGFLAGAVLFSLVAAGIYFTGNAVVDTSLSQPTGMSSIPYLILVLCGWIVQGASEEFIIRGVALKMFARNMKLIWAIIASSILFAAMHLGNNGIGVTSFLNLTLFGIAMCLYVIKTRSLWGACALHSAWNFFQGNIFGFEVSGINIKTGTLIDLNTSGNTLISGGIFGPESGVMTFAAYAAFIIVLAYMISKDRECFNITPFGNNVNIE